MSRKLDLYLKVPISIHFSQVEFISSINMSILKVKHYSVSGYRTRSTVRSFTEPSGQQHDNTRVKTILHSKGHQLCVKYLGIYLLFSCYRLLSQHIPHVSKKKMKTLQVITLLLCENSYKGIFWNVRSCVM